MGTFEKITTLENKTMALKYFYYSAKISVNYFTIKVGYVELVTIQKMKILLLLGDIVLLN